MHRLPLYSVILLTLSLLACNTQKKAIQSQATEINKLDQVQQVMIGSYDSSSQAERDSNYYNISLHMYPIWQSTGEHYLYVEQALANKQESPYRQRVYKLIQDNGRIASIVYTLPNPEEFVGKWKNTQYFDQFSPDMLILREGCAVYLDSTDYGWKGSTNEKDCKSSLRGASYATSIVSIYSDRIESWDQGFDSDDNQVWGATLGGYIFEKLE